MSKIIVPSDGIDQTLPLYAAIGLSETESNSVFFTVTEDIIPTKKTVAECLLAITEKKSWTDKEKVWAAFNLKQELLVSRGVPRSIVDMLGIA